MENLNFERQKCKEGQLQIAKAHRERDDVQREMMHKLNNLEAQNAEEQKQIIHKDKAYRRLLRLYKELKRDVVGLKHKRVAI